jgi:hypothetical protein
MFCQSARSELRLEAQTGRETQEAGSPFEALIDHPSWFGRVKHFINSNDGGFDTVHGPVFIDENLANFRGPGEAIGMHSGGQGLARNAYHYQAGRFMAMQVNVLIALADIGEGDGGTMVCAQFLLPLCIGIVQVTGLTISYLLADSCS